MNIYTARSVDIINGISKNKFAPEANITYEQAIKMIVAALGYNEEAKEKGGYPNGYINVAHDLGILKDISFKNTDFAIRGDIAKIVRAALDVPFYFLTNETGTVQREKSLMTMYEIHNITYSEVKEDVINEGKDEEEANQQSTEQGVDNIEDYNDETAVQGDVAADEAVLSVEELETVG